MAIYTQAQVDEAIRKTLSPYISHTYIPDGSEVPIAILANTPTKYILPVTAKEINGFGIFDPGGPAQALQFQAAGKTDILFTLDASTDMTVSVNNTTVKLMLYKNGTYVPGTLIRTKVSSTTDVKAMSINSTFRASTGDLLEVYVEADNAINLEFFHTSIVILEAQP